MGLQSRPVIEVCELSHSYFSGTPLEVASLREVDLVVNRDENVGIIGPTGSGKSTLLSHLNGLIRPQKGDVRVFGESLADSRADVRKVRKRIGMLFQNPEQQLFERYAGDDVAFGPKNFHIAGEELRIAVKRAMELVGLPFAYKDRLTTDLSLGEKRRLALAGVFALDPEILVLDEPTASLDPEGRRQVLEVLKQWRKRAGRSIVVVSHNMEDIVELSETIYILTDGSVEYSGMTEELFTNPELLIDQGLGLTVPQQVIQGLLHYGMHINEGMVSALELAEEIGRVLHGTAS